MGFYSKSSTRSLSTDRLSNSRPTGFETLEIKINDGRRALCRILNLSV